MSFDRVAAVYDETRILPENVTGLIADRVVAATGAGKETRFLEVGIGTGRIALPFVERGYRFTGVDLSPQMMARLREKVGGDRPNLELVEGDVTALPFPDASFDVTIAVHVLHLIADWTRAIDEIERVTEPHGFFVVGSDMPRPDLPGQEIRVRWRDLVVEEGGTPRPRYTGGRDIEAELINRGYRMAEYLVARWSYSFRPIDLMEHLRARSYSQTWTVSDDVLERVHERLVKWGAEKYGSVESEVQSEAEFLLIVSRFPPRDGG